MKSIPRLHILTDTTVQQRYSHYDLAKAAFEVGGIAVQYRNKQFDPNLHGPEFERIAALAKSLEQVLIVNDLLPIAVKEGVSGLHVGQEDAGVAEARELLGNKAIIGATVHNIHEQDGLANADADYHGIGPVFGTTSKRLELPPLGLEGLKKLVERSRVPVIAIGNIQLEDIPAVMHTGVHGIAVISAYCMADDLQNRARQLLEAVESHG